MPTNYALWNHSTPTTDWGAKVTAFLNVNNVAVIEVHEANYRDSTPLSGIFELVNPDTEPRMLWGSLRAEVYCAWHGVKPLSVFPQIIVGARYKIHQKYSGKVADNIA